MTTERAGYERAHLRSVLLPEWFAAAACKGAEPELFYSPDPDDRDAAHPDALALCAACPIRQQCLAYALAHEPCGVWGGLTPDERRELGGVWDAQLSRLHRMQGAPSPTPATAARPEARLGGGPSATSVGRSEVRSGLASIPHTRSLPATQPDPDPSRCPSCGAPVTVDGYCACSGF